MYSIAMGLAADPSSVPTPLVGAVVTVNRPKKNGPRQTDRRNATGPRRTARRPGALRGPRQGRTQQRTRQTRYAQDGQRPNSSTVSSTPTPSNRRQPADLSRSALRPSAPQKARWRPNPTHPATTDAAGGRPQCCSDGADPVGTVGLWSPPERDVSAGRVRIGEPAVRPKCAGTGGGASGVVTMSLASPPGAARRTRRRWVLRGKALRQSIIVRLPASSGCSERCCSGSRSGPSSGSGIPKNPANKRWTGTSRASSR